MEGACAVPRAAAHLGGSETWSLMLGHSNLGVRQLFPFARLYQLQPPSRINKTSPLFTSSLGKVYPEEVKVLLKISYKCFITKPTVLTAALPI